MSFTADIEARLSAPLGSFAPPPRAAVTAAAPTDDSGQMKPRRERRQRGHHTHAKPYSGGAQTTRCYVGNLPYRVEWQDLKDHFKPCGDVVYAKVLKNREGRSAGCGIVEFSNAADVQRAITQLSNTTIGDSERLIFVREDSKDRAVKREESSERSVRSSESRVGRQVFVTNLPFDVSWQDLKDAFRMFGEVARADVLQRDGRSQGLGTVLFENASDARRCVSEGDGADINGRIIHVEIDQKAF